MKTSNIKAAGKKITKRFKATKDIQLLTANIKKDLDVSKTIIQLIQEHIVGDPTSTYKGYDIVYYVPISKRKRNTSEIPNNIAPASQKSSAYGERYLVLLMKSDNKNAFFLKLIRQGNELEIKTIYNMRQSKSIDLGETDLELILSLEASDHSLYYYNKQDRDECLWIAAQVAKLSVGDDFSVSYSVDMEALTYMMTTSGAFQKFPFLKKYISFNSSQFGDQFGMDEAAAEQILDEINWSSSMSSLHELQSILNKKSDVLNDEIIDFLLQWEEMDDASSKEASTGNKRNSAKPVGLRDTTDVLNALSLVDRELAAVDFWLGEQAERLSEIQSNLFLIEDESAALETSWQSLNVVHDIITFLIDKYSLDPDQESVLIAPDKILATLMNSSSLLTMETKLAPLLNAATALKNALLNRELDNFGLGPADWKQINAIQIVSTQKLKLEELSMKFCSKFGDLSAQLFDWLLKHKACIEGENGQTGIVPKQFLTRNVMDDIAFAIVSQSGTTAITPNRFRNIRVNQLLDAQSVYHNHLSTFIPLLDILSELSPIHGRNLYPAYKQATRDRLYSPLVKAFVKDIRGTINYLQPPITFTTATRYRCNAQNDLLISYQSLSKGSSTKLVTAWRVMEVVLYLIIPMIEAEEIFLSKLFHYENENENGDDGDGLPKVLDMMEVVFEEMLKRITSITATSVSTTNSTQTDGIEAIALMTTLKHYITQYQEQLFASDGSVESPITPLHSAYILNLFKSLQESFEHRVHAFVSEQLKWINSQKADVKTADVLIPFQRYPILVMHIFEMSNGETMEVVDEACHKIAKELFSWLNTVAKSNDKYGDKVKITNYRYFQLSIGQLNVSMLQQFVAHAGQQVQESTQRYLLWMVEYEFPSLSVLAVRLDGVGGKVNDEELSLYIRRKDVLNVIKELEGKTLDSIVQNLNKRLEKHFRSDFDAELQLLPQLWNQLKDRMVGVLSKLEIAASFSYQIKLDFSPSDLSKLFDKYAFAAVAPST